MHHHFYMPFDQEEGSHQGATLSRSHRFLESMFQQSDALLHELQSRNIPYSINQSGRLVLRRKLPEDLVELLPTDMIPLHVLRLHGEYKDGVLCKELIGSPRFHERIKTQRRYGLIPPVVRKSAAQKRTEAREYLRRWRREHSLPRSLTVASTAPL